jgi:hypothetical protein
MTGEDLLHPAFAPVKLASHELVPKLTLKRGRNWSSFESRLLFMLQTQCRSFKNLRDPAVVWLWLVTSFMEVKAGVPAGE